MRLVRHLAFVIALVSLAASSQAANTTARLVLSHETVKPGETVWAGVHLRMAPKWHTYWENGGDSGGPTKIDWTLPAAVTAGEIFWPVPEKYDSGGLITYVYHNEVVLLVPLSIAANAVPGPLDLKAKVSWLECAESCFPASAQVGAKLNVGNSSKPSAEATLIETGRKKLPQPKPTSFAKAWWEKQAEGDKRPLLIEWMGNAMAKEFDFYPNTSTNAAVQTATEIVSSESGKVRLRKPVEKLEGGAWPDEISGLLVEKDAGGSLQAAYQISLSLPKPALVEQKPLIIWLVFAFLGGLVLNLMPCVLPVIALKIFGFVNQAQETPARVRQLGLIYGLGVTASFLVLAGAVIGLQSLGKQVSWGMQFGDARFLVVMTTLATLVSLNLFGLFEITLGGGAMGAASELASREGPAGAFFNGILATALSTPCSAPFLAGALGFAFAQPPAIIVLFFATIGFGLAAPYMILSFQPAWLKFLPKPGAWMERFKVAMGFPMLATAVWLFTLTIDHYQDVLWLGFFLVLIALSLWVYGEFVQRGTRRKALALVIALMLALIGYGYGLEKELRWRTPAPPAKAAAGEDEIIKFSPDGIEWRRWSLKAVAKARAEGRPILVDFWAKWCVTCNANKKTSIEIDSVRAKLKEINAVALLGDYTLLPPEITEELKRFGRAAVPLVLVYPKDASKPPVELPTILTPGIVLDALERAAK